MRCSWHHVSVQLPGLRLPVVSEFLLFTVLTPLYITLIYDLLEQTPSALGYLLSAALAVIGAAIIRYDKVSDHFWTGLMFVQLANISFAIGMVGYKRLMETRPMPQHNAFARGSIWARRLSRWWRGLCSVIRKAADHRRAAFGLAGRGGVRAGLLHVELRRDAGRRRYAGDHEQRVPSRGCWSTSPSGSNKLHWPGFHYWGR